MTDPTLDVGFERGDILVARQTNPVWNPLIAMAAAVVVEVGGLVSHAARTAQALRVPCVVDVKGCTEHIEVGELIRIDAERGWIEVVAGS